MCIYCLEDEPIPVTKIAIVGSRSVDFHVAMPAGYLFPMLHSSLMSGTMTY